MKLKTSLFAALVAIAACVTTATDASAVQLSAWDMFGQPGTQATTPTSSSAANITGTDMTRGAGLSTSGAGNAMSSSSWGSTAASPAVDTEYFSFGFNVDTGFQVDLDELIIGTRSSNTGPGTIGVYSNQDGFTTALATIVQQGSDFANSIIDLSSLTGVTGTLELRLIEIGNTQADGSGTTSNGGTFRVVDYYDGSNFVDTQLTGTVSAVPEPGALAGIFSLGLVGAAVGRRRRR
ncbi:hypothetical protein Enr13x_21250 [Stieleria neptunia]|uniref:PEP-CTERM protein-sorting domain-containing protein n=1 Tax=Stieleria neptunia TaxID=2527979 RepID=A0A518HN89_9BACT|nr:PEP-CTERM sorting domain-containing protein [Stieleria neptunia]QDV42280.1 hypothetical protein Enr13x_21250 [Stieleria neptunia]